MPLVIGVPGKWGSVEGLKTALQQSQEGKERFVIQGELLVDTANGFSLLVDCYGRNPSLHITMERLGGGLLNAEAQKAIQTHTCVAYLVEEDAKKGSLEFATNIVALTSAVLEAGGLAVLVESTGAAHSKEAWKELSALDCIPALYRTLVATVHSIAKAYTCGMHFFGIPDSSLPTIGVRPGSTDVQEVLASINLAGILGASARHKWSTGLHAGVYTVTAKERYIEGYAEDDPKWNPHGVLELTGPQDVLDIGEALGIAVPDWPGGEPLMFDMEGGLNEEYHQAEAQATASVDLFLQLCFSELVSGTPTFKAAIPVGEGLAAVWMLFLGTTDAGQWKGGLFEDFEGLDSDVEVVVPQSCVIDWSWSCAGCVVGGWTSRVARSRVAAEHRPYYDLYTGSLCYA